MKKINALLICLCLLITNTLLISAEEENNITIYSTPSANGAVAQITGNLPSQASAIIEDIELSQEEIITYFGEEKAASMKDYVAYDIKIMVDDTLYQPDETVNVTVKQPDIAPNKDIEALHIDQTTNEGSQIEAHFSEEGDLNFDTDGFSLFIFYTVDFHYGEEDHIYSIAGGSSILLSQLFEAIGYNEHTIDEVTSVTFTNYDLIAVEKIDNDWKLTSLSLFDSEEYLTIYFGEEELEILVTDAIHNNMFSGINDLSICFSCTPNTGYHDFTVYLLDTDGTTIATGYDNDVISSAGIIANGNYWFEVTTYNRCGTMNYPLDAEALAGASVHMVTLGAIADFPCHREHSITIKRHPLNIIDNDAVTVDQVSEFVLPNDTQTRTVEIYIDGILASSQNTLFPDRDKTGDLLNRKGWLYDTDIGVTVKDGYILDTSKGGGDGKTADTSSKTYRIYLLSNKHDVSGSFYENHGTVTNNSQLNIPDGNNCEAMVFTPETGYKITGITINGTPVTNYQEDGYTFPVQAITENKTVIAYTAPIYYQITYQLDGGVLTATNPASYNIETATFSLNNPTKDGYIFTGWTGSNGTVPQTQVSINKGSTGDKTYAANWQESLGSLIIKKTGCADIDEDQSFIFFIQSTALANTGHAPVELYVSVQGNGTVTIDDLPIGTYEVEEISSWSWRYSSDGTKTVNVDNDGETLIFSNNRTNIYWLNSTTYKINKKEEE